MTTCESLIPKKIQIAILVWEGMTNREIGKIVGTSEQVIKNHLRSAFDKLGVWSRLELAMYVASHDGKNWPSEPEHPAMPYSQAVAASRPLSQRSRERLHPYFFTSLSRSSSWRSYGQRRSCLRLFAGLHRSSPMSAKRFTTAPPASNPAIC